MTPSRRRVAAKTTIERRPFIRIERSRGLLNIDFGEFWMYRELLYFFTWRDVKVRYKQTVLGAGWAVLQPFLMMVVFAVFLGRLAHVPSEGIPYPIFAYSALVPWTLFASSLTGASNSLVDAANLVSKVYFPRLILPIAAASSYLLDFLIAFALLVAMMFFYGIRPTTAIVWIPVLTAFAFLAANSVGILFAAVNVRYRDVKYAVPFIAQLWLFATPVAYPASIVPERFRVLVGLNPMAGVVEGFRWALLGTRRPSGLITVSIAVTLVLLTVGLSYFHHTERTFADWI
jgi:lipopolysaccharide transport system permease protein